jgi:hypothetical protein
MLGVLAKQVCSLLQGGGSLARSLTSCAVLLLVVDVGAKAASRAQLSRESRAAAACAVAAGVPILPVLLTPPAASAAGAQVDVVSQRVEAWVDLLAEWCGVLRSDVWVLNGIGEGASDEGVHCETVTRFWEQGLLPTLQQAAGEAQASGPTAIQRSRL